MSAVAKCIAKVQAQLAKEGISKERKNQQQGYSFRGIDDVYNALSSLLADAGLVIIPSYEVREITEREAKSGGALFCVVVKGMYTLIASEDGSELKAGPFWGEAMDSADKATNKAMSAAYKYMAMQVFAIPTEGDNDADKTTPDVKATSSKLSAAAGVIETLDIIQQKTIRGYASKLTDLVLNGEVAAAYLKYEDYKTKLTTDEQVALRGEMPSNVRSALLKESERIKQSSLRAMAREAGSQA